MNGVELGTPSTRSLALPVALVHPSIEAEAFHGANPFFLVSANTALSLKNPSNLLYLLKPPMMVRLLTYYDGFGELKRAVSHMRNPLRVRCRSPPSLAPKMGDVAAPASEPEAVLPNWLEEMMEPGVGAGVFLTLKLALIGLVATLCLMLSFTEDLTIRFHLKVFLGLASVLAVIVIWFISELKKDADGGCGKAAKDAGAKKAQ